MTEAEFDDDLTRPCLHCGKPVPQRHAAGRPFRYCRDNDGECQRAARNTRLRHRTSPGLSGQVARAHEVAERLDKVVATLIEALHDEVSADGVERQLVEMRARSATEIAAAHAERDDARKAATAARDAASTAAARAAEADATREVAAQALRTAREAADEAETRARDAATAAQTADAAATLAATEREAARREAATEAALRAEAYRERDAARTTLADAVRERDAALTATERAVRERADAEARLQRLLDAETARADAAVIATANARDEAERAHGWVDDLRGQLAVAREQTAEALNQAAEAATATKTAEKSMAEALRTAERSATAAAIAQAGAEAGEAELAASRRRIAELEAQVSNLASALARLTAPDGATVAG